MRRNKIERQKGQIIKLTKYRKGKKMSLRFYPMFEGQQEEKAFDNLDKKSVLKLKQEGQTIIISLIDLKPQQLPMPHRKFISCQSNKTVKEQDNNSNYLQREQEQVYSNMEWMVWVSNPIQIQHLQWLQQQNHSNSNKQHEQEKNKVYVRYLYLPPLSQYMKHYAQRFKQLNPKTSNNSNTHIQQLSHLTQLAIEQRHQVMYCLARQLSSAIVFQFGSKYIRFDYLSFQDYHQAVFQKIITKDHKNIKHGLKGLICQNEEIPHYVVIKSSNYSSERDFEVYKVKLSNSTNSSNSLNLSSRSQSSSLNISMEIESKSIVSIQKTLNSETNQQSIKQLVEMSDNLLKLTQNKITKQKTQTKQNEPNSKGKSQDMQTFSTGNSSCIDNLMQEQSEQNQSTIGNLKTQQIEGDQKIWISKQSIKWIKPIQYSLLMRILRYYCGNEICNREKLPDKISKRNNKQISKKVMDKAVCYYSHSINMMKQIQLLKQSNKGLLRREVLRQILTEIMFDNRNSDNQKQIQQNLMIGKGISFEIMEEVQKFMVDYLREHILIEHIEKQQLSNLNNQQRLLNNQQRLSELIKTIQNNQQLSIAQVQRDLIEQVYSNLSQFVESHLITLMRNQCLELIDKQFYPTNSQIDHQPSDSQLPYTHNSKNTIIPILNIQIPTQIKHNLSQQLYSVLNNKLSPYHLNHPSYLPLIFSYPLQSQYLKTTISLKDSHIHKLNQQIGILQVQLNEKQSIIQNQQSQISQYKLDQVFYQQVLNQLNQLQAQLNHQIQIKKKLTIDLQCTQILNLQANQTIQTHQIKQSRLLQQKQNFLQAISHLSKENLHYITLSQKLQSTIDSLNKKIDHYQFIDIQINSLNLLNQQLKHENQSIKQWKSTIEQSHQDLMLKQVHQFNHVLKINFDKFTQTKQQLEDMKNHLKSLTHQLEIQTKNNLILQEQIHYLKSNYFHLNHITIDYPHSNNPILNSLALH